MVEKKYEFTGEKNGVYHRIRALRDFGFNRYEDIPELACKGVVKAGDLGGWIKSEDDLSHEGNCWVFDDCVVSGGKISGDALVLSNSSVRGSFISGQAIVRDKSKIEYSKILDDAIVVNSEIHQSKISGASVVSQSVVCQKSVVQDSLLIKSVVSQHKVEQFKLIGEYKVGYGGDEELDQCWRDYIQHKYKADPDDLPATSDPDSEINFNNWFIDELWSGKKTDLNEEYYKESYYAFRENFDNNLWKKGFYEYDRYDQVEYIEVEEDRDWLKYCGSRMTPPVSQDLLQQGKQKYLNGFGRCLTKELIKNMEKYRENQLIEMWKEEKEKSILKRQHGDENLCAMIKFHLEKREGALEQLEEFVNELNKKKEEKNELLLEELSKQITPLQLSKPIEVIDLTEKPEWEKNFRVACVDFVEKRIIKDEYGYFALNVEKVKLYYAVSMHDINEILCNNGGRYFSSAEEVAHGYAKQWETTLGIKNHREKEYQLVKEIRKWIADNPYWVERAKEERDRLEKEDPDKLKNDEGLLAYYFLKREHRLLNPDSDTFLFPNKRFGVMVGCFLFTPESEKAKKYERLYKEWVANGNRLPDEELERLGIVKC